MFSSALISSRKPQTAVVHSGLGIRRAAELQAPTATRDQPWPLRWILLFILLHPMLALAMRQVHLLGALHALLVLTLGLVLGFSGRKPVALAQWMSYVVGAEVLWRMCKAPIPWEFAKYCIALVCLAFVFRSGFRGSWTPLLYFLLLVPSAIFTFIEFPLDMARRETSFYLSGPACLAFTAIGFSRTRLTEQALQRIGVCLLAPLAGIAFLAFFKMATTEVTFGSASSSDSSGGFGPNQVSAMLSLGALAAVFLYLLETRSRVLGAFLLFLGLWFLGQAAVTFSRTGLYLFGAAILVAAVFLIQSRGKALNFLRLAFLVAAIACAVAPRLDAFTGGKLAERYKDKGITGRGAMAGADFRMFLERPIFGHGIGMSMAHRAVAAGIAAHTEYTRVLAEHGILGLAALILLFGLTLKAFLVARGPMPKALVAAFATWALLFMVVSAMRLAAPAFLLGLIHARFLIAARAPRAARKLGQSFSRSPLPYRSPTSPGQPAMAPFVRRTRS